MAVVGARPPLTALVSTPQRRCLSQRDSNSVYAVSCVSSTPCGCLSNVAGALRHGLRWSERCRVVRASGSDRVAERRWRGRGRGWLAVSCTAGSSGFFARARFICIPGSVGISIRRAPLGRPLDEKQNMAGKRVRFGLWVPSLCAQPSDSSIPTFNEDEYEEVEETEEEARRRNWVERRWAPWEEILSPEGQFAVDSLAPGEEEPVVSWEAFEKLKPKYQEETRRKIIEEAERKEREKKPISLEGTFWEQPLVFTLRPPRDWPPPGWTVDAQELAFIRESQSLENVLVSLDDLKDANEDESVEPSFDRWKMFLKQYNEWVAANKERLDKEALEVDPEYYPGRRRTGTNYREGMYELPYIYPGQHYWGVVSSVHLYEGAFVHYGGVHDGWVAIRDNDWYYIREHIKVGMRVQVEVLAKRDPYRFRFPVEMRFVDPNIDHLIFRRFENPPIFARPGDDNLDEVARDSNRPYFPKLRPESKPKDELKALVHPSVPRVWQLYQAEEMVLDDEEGRNDNTISFYDEDDDEDWEVVEEPLDIDEDNFEPQWFEGGVGGYEIPTLVLNTDPKDLDLASARAEREEVKRLWDAAKARGEEFVQPKTRLERRVAELNAMHTRRRQEEIEATIRDTACRIDLGLPVEEPGRYADKEFWGKNQYDPKDPRWRHDYWGDPSKLKDELRREKEPRTVRAEETVAEEEDEVLEDKEEEEDEVEEPHVDSSTPVKKVTEDRGVVNGTTTLRMDDVRGMFTMEAEDDWKTDQKDDGNR